MAKSCLPSVEMIRQLVTVNMETGEIRWNFRPRSLFRTDGEFKRWNGRYAGKIAFNGVSKTGYKVGRVGCCVIFSHHVVWAVHYGYWPKSLDHENGDRALNRLSNLREATNGENNKNKSRYSNNTSGYPGVHFGKHIGKWIARIGVGAGRRSLGCFDCLEDAINAKKIAEMELGYHRNHGR